jgi:arylsulfatase
MFAYAKDRRETLGKKPNIVLILAENVFIGTGDLPFFWPDDESKSKVQMPHLKELVSKGVTFQDAHSSPKCGPSRYSVLSGNYAHRGTRLYGTYNFDQESSQCRKYQVV